MKAIDKLRVVFVILLPLPKPYLAATSPFGCAVTSRTDDLRDDGLRVYAKAGAKAPVTEVTAFFTLLTMLLAVV